MSSPFKFRLLRYAPNRLSEEFYNVGVLLYDAGGRLLDARLAPDFSRLRSNPIADLQFLQALREEFEDRRLGGEGFSGHIAGMIEHLSQSLHLTDERYFLGDDMAAELDRLTQTYLETPRLPRPRREAASPGTRRWVRSRMRETLHHHGLQDHLESEVAVGSYVSPRFSFQIDYAYRPNGATHYLQALSAKHDLTDAGRLCFVFDRIRARTAAHLTAVVTDGLPEDTHALLESSQIQPWPVSRLANLAEAVRKELRLD